MLNKKDDKTKGDNNIETADKNPANSPELTDSNSTENSNIHFLGDGNTIPTPKKIYSL